VEQMMEVEQAIRTKRAVRDFTRRPLPAAVVRLILDAGRRAQSSKNTQPWRFIAVQDPATLTRLAELGEYAGHLRQAALGVVIVTPDPSQRWSIMFDAGQAAAYMQLAAWSAGVASVPGTMYQSDAAGSLLGVPDDWHIHVALSFGYPRDPRVMAAQPRAGGRLSLDQVAYAEHWGQPIE
jgi:nitroreductase